MMRALLFSVFLLMPIVSCAADLSLIAGSWSHHFVPRPIRKDLNQSQDTRGLEFATPGWNLQLSHMRDSFGCSSNQAALSRRWSIHSGKNFMVGVTLGFVAAHRCTDQRVVHIKNTSVLVPVGSSSDYIPSLLSGGLYEECHPTTVPVCTILQLQTKQVITVTQLPPRWVFGVVPGVYAQIGRNIQAELTLIRSPWAGHHWVAYTQISFVVWRF